MFSKRVGGLLIACGALLAATAQPAQAAPFELVTNGGFETGDFTGWTTVIVGTPLSPWTVSTAGAGSGFGMAPTAPQGGAFDAWNGFDGGGPMEFQMFQDIAISSAVTSALFSADYRAQWDFSIGGTATQPRLFDVEVRNPTTDAVLGTLHSFSTGTQATNPTGDTGWVTIMGDVSAYSGQTVRLFFREQIPESFTGPGQIEFDNISIQAVPEPGTYALFGLGVLALGLHRRRRRGKSAA